MEDVIRAILQDASIPERVRFTFVGSIVFTAPECLTPRLIENLVRAAYNKHGIVPPRFTAPRRGFRLAPLMEEEEEEEDDDE